MRQLPQDIEAEKSALGCILIDPAYMDDVRDAIASAEDFYNTSNATIYHAMVDLLERNTPLDAVTLTGKLHDMGVYDQVGGADYITELIGFVPGPSSAGVYASRVAEKALCRRLIEQQEIALESLYSGSTSAASLIDSRVNQLIEMRPSDRKDSAKLDHWLQESLKDERPGIPCGLHAVDDIVEGFEPGSYVVVGARPSVGKAQPLDAKVLTEAGWGTMGDLSVGDRLASVDGGESVVTGIYPQGVREVRKITFSDGRSTKCCREHLWRVMYREWDEPRVVNTDKLESMLTCKRYQKRLYIEQFSGEFGIKKMLPIDPWLLGFLIGDGCMTGGSLRFSTSCPDTCIRVQTKIGSLCRVVQASKYDYRITTSEPRGFDGRFPTTPLNQCLRNLGLWGAHSYEKSIPDIYREADKRQRLDLLAGLIDSDGWIEKSGTMMYGTTSPQLASDVVDLVRSLGGYCSRSTKQPTYTYGGERREGRRFHVLSIDVDGVKCRLASPSKRARCRESADKSRVRRLSVVSVEPSGEAETQCISVSHPSHLYVTDDYTVTHNTAFGISVALEMATAGTRVGFVSAEMSGKRVARRFVCAEAGISTKEFSRDKQSIAVQGVVARQSEMPLWVDQTPGAHIDRVCSRLRRWKREHDIQVAFVDYLQLLQTDKEKEYEGVTDASRKLNALKGELDITIVALAQLNRGNTQRQDKRPAMADLRGSGAVEQDADIILMLHRDAYYTDGQDILDGKVKDDEAQILVEKNRDGRTGTAHVGWIGRCGVFTSGMPQGPAIHGI